MITMMMMMIPTRKMMITMRIKMITMTQAAHSSESSVYTVAQPHEAQGVYTPDLTQVNTILCP